MTADKAARQLEAEQAFAGELGRQLQFDASLRLWDGSLVPLGPSRKASLGSRSAAPG